MLFIVNKDKTKRSVLRIEDLPNIDVYEDGFEPYIHNYGYRTTVGELKNFIGNFSDDLSASICLDDDDEISIFIGEYVLASNEQELRDKWREAINAREKQRALEKEEVEYQKYLELKKKYECTTQQ